MNYKEDLSIDKFNLDYEWETQPAKYIEWAEKCVNAQFEKDKAKDMLDLIEAQLDSEIRLKSEKQTEAKIKSQILQDKRYIEAKNLYIESIKNARILEIAKDAFEHKKKALEKITDLWISGYWSSPKINNNLKEGISRYTRENHLNVLSKNERMIKRKTCNE